MSSNAATSSTTITNTHPLYLHPSNYPGMVLVTTPFNGSGYGSWRRGMLISLSAKRKLGFINGTVIKPGETDPTFENWSMCNDMVIAWILNSLDEKIVDTVMHTKTASVVWKEIEKRYGQASGIKVFQIRKDISSISQDEWVKLEGDQRVHQFLAGLNDSYAGIRRNILMMKPLPNLDSVYPLLIHDERQSELQASIPSFASEAASFSANTRNQKSSPSYPQRVNFESRKPNYSQKPNYSHNQSTYPQKPNYSQNQFNYSQNQGLYYKYCKRSGHSIEKCHRLHRYPSDFQFNKGKKTAACVQGFDLHGFSQEQHDHIINLLGVTSLYAYNISCFFACHLSQMYDNPWILDSGGHSLKKPLVVGKLSNGLYVLQLNGSSSSTPSFAHAVSPNPATSSYSTPTTHITSIIPAISTITSTIPAISTDCNSCDTSAEISTPYVNSSQASDSNKECSSASFNTNVPLLSDCMNVNALPPHLPNDSVVSPDLSWHQRLGCMPFAKMKSIPYLKSILPSKQTFHCSICPMARLQRLP
ncbi:uncharacterized protein LOC132054306 [Lycium ferocissimum]|uniref:uncharacterized protein LOC132054306 n=1 Tax=Lycium ferocissimum TaxID=112874 RepID=UPI0028161A89|nr:uncharacterized protein LOC132054306 [Lycium ferocissimum]